MDSEPARKIFRAGSFLAVLQAIVYDARPRRALRGNFLAGSLVRLILRAQGKTKEADAEEQQAKELGAKHPD
jgi:hypothetical protein